MDGHRPDEPQAEYRWRTGVPSDRMRALVCRNAAASRHVAALISPQAPCVRQRCASSGHPPCPQCWSSVVRAAWRPPMKSLGTAIT